MKLWIFFCMVAAVVARPADVMREEVNIVLDDRYNPGGDKGFHTTVEQSDGTMVETRGKLVKVVTDGKEVNAFVIEGSYSFYIGDVKYTVRYKADQNGYQPTFVQGSEGPPGIAPSLVAVHNSIVGR